MTVRSGDLSAADIHRITEAALAHLELDELLDVLLERIREILDVDTVAILLLEEGDMLRARAAKGLEEEVTQHFSVRVGAGFAGRIAQERRPVVIGDHEPFVVGLRKRRRRFDDADRHIVAKERCGR